MSGRPRAVGLNHVAIEVDDVEAAVAFFRRIFDIELRGRTAGSAFLDLGDQFLALSEGRTQSRDEHRHIGLVVDDREAVRRRLVQAGAEIVPGRGLDFRDPSGNRYQVVAYDEVQFTKAAHVLEGMGLGALGKTDAALEELRRKGIAPASRLDAVDPAALPKEELARLLREAEQAHAEYERDLGERDEDWPTWYAGWILDQLRRRAAGPDA